MRALGAVVVAFAGVTACGGPSFHDGDFHCGPAGECPPGFGCVEEVCRDQAAPPDAFMADAPPGGPFVYAHDPTTLYQVALQSGAIMPVGPFQLPSGTVSEAILDLAVSREGTLVASTASTLYLVDPTTAACRAVSTALPEPMTGLTYLLDGESQVLVGAARAGSLYRFDAGYIANAAGPIGLGGCDGDLVWTGQLLGTIYVDLVATTQLATIDPLTGTTTALGDTGRRELNGLVVLAGVLYAFAGTQEILELDVATGLVLRSLPTPGIAWYGAASPP